jgi:hypothetical protein
LRDREAGRVLLQALDAEEFGAQQFVIVPGWGAWHGECYLEGDVAG